MTLHEQLAKKTREARNKAAEEYLRKLCENAASDGLFSISVPEITLKVKEHTEIELSFDDVKFFAEKEDNRLACSKPSMDDENIIAFLSWIC